MPTSALLSPKLQPRVLVVLLNWNSADETVAAVASVQGMRYANLQILVIDNGSVDGSPEVLKRLKSDSVELMLRRQNEGFTGGCNLGFGRAVEGGFDYVWLLNNDATTDPETLASLVRTAEENPKIGLVSPRIASLQDPSIHLNLGGLYRPEVPLFESTKDMAKAERWAREQPERVMLMGTALLVRVELIRSIGLLDNRMFAYWEDTDYSLRSLQAGFLNRVDFHSVIYHKEKDAGRQAQTMKPHYWYYMARNEVRFWRKHASGRRKAKALWWCYLFNRHNLRLLPGNEVSRQAILAGLWDGWTGRTGAYQRSRRMPGLLSWLVGRPSTTVAATEQGRLDVASTPRQP